MVERKGLVNTLIATTAPQTPCWKLFNIPEVRITTIIALKPVYSFFTNVGALTCCEYAYTESSSSTTAVV